jgi:uncharacterized protein YejL (UPF0352 family)
MTKDQIKKILLAVAGNPTVGSVKQIADAQAQAVADALADALSPKTANKKEDRILDSEETR